MDNLPLFLNIRDRDCLVIGGGQAALAKIELLLKAGGHVTVAASSLHDELQTLADSKRIEHIDDAFTPALLDGKCLVIVAVEGSVDPAPICQQAMSRHIPINVVDQPEFCSVTFPAIVDRSPVVIAVSSNGHAPVLTRLIREKLESLIPAHYGRLARIAGLFRDELKKRLPSVTARRYFWESVFSDGLTTNRLTAGSEQEGLQQLRDRLAAEEDSLQNPEGEVYLVGAGPGNPDLLTFRALRLMQQADVVLYDRLVSPEILDRVRRDAEKIDVGKSRDRHLQTQDKINELMLHYAKQGKRVCRLKGGDPFIFGRGGEELELLAEHGIRFEVVPGVTAATGAATYAGIPLTHRDYAQSCIFVTGHMKNGELALAGGLDWKSLTRPMQTVVFYMGLKNLPLVSEHLLQNGMVADMPAALVENATLPEQRVVTGTITTLPALAQEHNVQPPALLIVGEVVKLQSKLAWFNETSENLDAKTQRRRGN